MKKVMLILIDGMRPDSLEGISQAETFMREGAFTRCARTVFPSVTLPCHMSLMHSVDPQRHGTTTNTFAPQVRPIDGLFDVLAMWKKRCGFFYNWEQLRDIARPGSLYTNHYISCVKCGLTESDDRVTEAALKSMREDDLDFLFVYLGGADETGHAFGWMGEEYLAAVRHAWTDVERLAAAAGDEYQVIITADHGGHERTHGTEMTEDMTIPVFLRGSSFAPGKELEKVSIKDIAPTVCALMGVPTPDEWEGNALV